MAVRATGSRGGGFGPRRLTSELVLLVVGYAAFLQLLPRRIRSWGALLLGIGLVLHQWILLRYGLQESIGGRVMSMAPTFYWEEVSSARFVSDLFALALRAWQRPLDFLILSGAPLDIILRKQAWPAQHLGTLLATGLFVIIVAGGVIVWGNRAKTKNHPVRKAA